MQNNFEDFATLSHLVQYLIHSPTIYQQKKRAKYIPSDLK